MKKIKIQAEFRCARRFPPRLNVLNVSSRILLDTGEQKQLIDWKARQMGSWGFPGWRKIDVIKSCSTWVLTNCPSRIVITSLCQFTSIPILPATKCFKQTYTCIYRTCVWLTTLSTICIPTFVSRKHRSLSWTCSNHRSLILSISALIYQHNRRKTFYRIWLSDSPWKSLKLLFHTCTKYIFQF